MEVRFYEVGEVDEQDMFYAVIASQYGGKWVFVQQKARNTWEMPAGRREEGESIFQTAQRELHEETGAVDFQLKEICDYSVTSGETRYGRLFFADIKELGPLPDSEIAELLMQEHMPKNLTYPEIQPLLLKKVIEKISMHPDGLRY